MNRIVALSLAILSVSGCASDKNSPTEPEKVAEKPVAEIFDTLYVTLLEGVSGIPNSGKYTYKRGESVDYSYSVSPGFEKGYVVRDSTLVDFSGTIVFTRNTSLVVGAVPVVSVKPEDAGTVASAENVLESLDSEAAYRLYLDEVSKMYEKHTRAEALSRLEAVSMRVYADADFESIRSASDNLSGTFFNLAVPKASSNMTGIRTEEWKGGVIFVNGMLNARSDPGVAGAEIQLMLRDAGLNFFAPVSVFYNSSLLREIDEDTYHFLTYSPVTAITGGVDVAVVVAQYLAAITKVNVAVKKVSESLASEIDKRLRSGEPVLLVGHSQGALVIREALSILSYKSSCVAVVTLGSPIGNPGWQMDSSLLDGVGIEGRLSRDIVLLSSNNFPRTSNFLSDEADKLIEANPLSPILRIIQGLKLHDLTRSYLGERSREVVTQKLKVAVTTLHNNPECSKEEIPSSIFAVSSDNNSSYTSQLWKVGPHTLGTDSLVGSIRLPNGRRVELTDIARQGEGQLWGTSFYTLYKIDEASLVASPVADWEGGHPNGMEFGPDGLLYMSTTDGVLAAFDIDTLERKWDGSLGKGYGSGGDIAFHPDGRGFAIAVDSSGKSYLARFSNEFPEAQIISKVPMETKQIFGIAFADDRLYGLSKGNYATKGALWSINITSGEDEFVREVAFDVYGASS